MAFWIQDGSRAKVAKFKDKDNIKHLNNYTTANLSSSRKNNQQGEGQAEYLYSDWGFVRFVGKAHTYMKENVKDGDVISIIKGQFTKESYIDKEGKKVYPQTAQLVVFDVELARGNGSGKSQAKVELPPEDDIPF